MQRDSNFLTGEASPAHAYEMGGYAHKTPLGGHYGYSAPAFGSTLAGTKRGFPCPMNGFEFQPSEVCPRNFIIFDQTDNINRVMFHPALVPKFNSSNFNPSANPAEVGGKSSAKNDNQDNHSSYLKEDTADIDALLSSEQDDDDDNDDDDDDDDDVDDVVSTGRTPGNFLRSSCDSSCSMKSKKSFELSFASAESASSGASSSEKKRERMRKMVKALRGIIPGGDQLDAPEVLDEAVRYLKSLKVELKTLGMQNLDA